jgi:hypothetical protein
MPWAILHRHCAARGLRGGEASGVGLWSAPRGADHNPRSPREGASAANAKAIRR